MLHTLLRLPSPRFPADMRTGDARVDRYLETLDSALAGSASVRKQTLFEARDYLTEALERARASNTDENAALRSAIEEFGQAEQIAGEQRRTCAAKFRTMVWWMGLPFAAMMLVLSLLGVPGGASSWSTLAINFVFDAVFIGVWIAYFMVYMVPNALPTLQDTVGQKGFSVHCTVLTVRLAWGLMIVIGTMQVLLAGGMIGRGFFSGWPLSIMILMLVSNVAILLVMSEALLFRATVQADALRLRGLGGRVEIKRRQIVSVDRPRLVSQLSSPTNAHLHCLVWRDDAGKTRSRYVSLGHGLVHGDRLMAWLEGAARENAAPAASPCLV